MCGSPESEADAEGPEISYPALLRGKAGVFVTLFHQGELRGCLGAAEGKDPLVTSVPRLARAAATKDSRFAPLEERELKALEVEITILGALTLLPADPEILLGGLMPELHGVYLRSGGRSGLYLPQVARRLGWGSVELLEQVSVKASLPKNAWQRPGTSLYGFTARSFFVSSLNVLPFEDGWPPDPR